MDNLVLVGFSCSGKTTIGRILARRLRLRFVDTDRVVEQTAGRTIPEIFAQDGEEAFRALERETVARICQERFQVISTGGGAFLDPHSQDQLCDDNLVVHLRIRPETVVQRLVGSRRGRPRPLLEGPDPLEKVRGLMEARRSAYARANMAIDVDDRTTYGIGADVVRQWYVWRRKRRGQRAAAPAAEGLSA